MAVCICNPGSWSCRINAKILVSIKMFIFLVAGEKEPYMCIKTEFENLNANGIFNSSHFHYFGGLNHHCEILGAGSIVSVCF